MDAWWRAANYLSVGQIYLRDNFTAIFLIPLTYQAAFTRAPGHNPRYQFYYCAFKSLNSFTQSRHAAGDRLKSWWSCADGMAKLCKQFSFPGGGAPLRKYPVRFSRAASRVIPSPRLWCGFDNPNLFVAFVIGNVRLTPDP